VYKRQELSPVVEIEPIHAVIGQEQIRIAVTVDVAHGGSHPVTAVIKPGRSCNLTIGALAIESIESIRTGTVN